MGNFVTWGVVGFLGGIVVICCIVAWWFDPSRPERARKRRAKRNQAWVRNKIKQNGVMGIDEEAMLIARARKQLEDPWTHLGSK